MEEQFSLSSARAQRHVPLAQRLRPRTLDEVIGQPQLTDEDAPLRRAVMAGSPPSMVLWGPPGTGKTTIALCLAEMVDASFEQLNAVTDGIKELRAIITRAQQRQRDGERTLLFIDEIARWNKAQQDALLPYVEAGTVILVGATTEHPSYELNRALLSRLQVYIVNQLSTVHLLAVAEVALRDVKRGVGIPADDERTPYELAEDAADHLLLVSDGDARRLLGIIERATDLTPEGGVLQVAVIERAAGHRALAYDKSGDEHYSTTSAFIKSVRGSDADAALYWLARMEAGGEDPVFVARRLVIASSEDVGTAASGALAVAVAGMEAVKLIGPPECWLNIAHVTAYLARAPKSQAAYQGLGRARQVVEKSPHYPVPPQLRNTPSSDESIGGPVPGAPASSGQGTEFLPVELAKLRGRIYVPSGNGQDK